MKIPLPRTRVRGSRSGRPIMALLDLLGRRMALRVLWELAQTDAPLTFRGLQSAADTNPSVLNSRLKELRAAAVVMHGDEGYRLSAEGKALVELVLPLRDWAETWSERLAATPSAASSGKRAAASRPSARRGHVRTGDR